MWKKHFGCAEEQNYDSESESSGATNGTQSSGFTYARFPFPETENEAMGMVTFDTDYPSSPAEQIIWDQMKKMRSLTPRTPSKTGQQKVCCSGKEQINYSFL